MQAALDKLNAAQAAIDAAHLEAVEARAEAEELRNQLVGRIARKDELTQRIETPQERTDRRIKSHEFIFFRKDTSLYDEDNDDTPLITETGVRLEKMKDNAQLDMSSNFPAWVTSESDKYNAITAQKEFRAKLPSATPGAYKPPVTLTPATVLRNGKSVVMTDAAGNELYKMAWISSTHVPDRFVGYGKGGPGGTATRNMPAAGLASSQIRRVGGSRGDVRYSPHSIREFAEEQDAWEKANDAYNQVPETYREMLPGPGEAPALELLATFKRYIDENAEEDPINDARDAVGMLSHEDLDEIIRELEAEAEQLLTCPWELKVLSSLSSVVFGGRFLTISRDISAIGT